MSSVTSSFPAAGWLPTTRKFDPDRTCCLPNGKRSSSLNPLPETVPAYQMQGKGCCRKCGQWSWGKRKCMRCSSKFCSTCMPPGPPLASCAVCDPSRHPSQNSHPAVAQFQQPGRFQPGHIATPSGGVPYPVQQHPAYGPPYSSGGPPTTVQHFQTSQQLGMHPGVRCGNPAAPVMPLPGHAFPASAHGPGSETSRDPGAVVMSPTEAGALGPPSQPRNGYVMSAATIDAHPPLASQHVVSPQQHPARVQPAEQQPPENRSIPMSDPHATMPPMTATVAMPSAHPRPTFTPNGQSNGAQGFGSPPLGYPSVANSISPTGGHSVHHNVSESQPPVAAEAQAAVKPPIMPQAPAVAGQLQSFGSRGKGTCFGCGQVKYGKAECLVCGTKFCVDCVPIAFGTKPEGVKCVGCVGQPIHSKHHFRLQACALPPEKVFVNGKMLTRSQLEVLLIQNFMFEPVADEGTDVCMLWYDRKSGLMGHYGKDSKRMIKSNLDLGHAEMDPLCSGGDIPIFLNGRHLNSKEVGRLKKIGVKLTPGRWWLDERGDFGQEESIQLKTGNMWAQLGKRAGLMILFAVAMGAAVDGLMGAEGLLEGGAGAGEAASGGGMTYMEGGGAIADFGDGSMGVSFTDASGTHHSFYSG